jgi:glycosyltransferase involved in cell wall biosynthesis
MSSPLVSVIITTYNRANLVHRAIDAVLAQDYESVEVIIVDDCSQDDTETVIKSTYSDKITYIRHTINQGVQFASNTGFSHSKGKYLAFIGDDDRWNDVSKLSKQVEIFENDISEVYGVVTTDVKVISKDKQYLMYIKRPRNLVKHILARNGIIYGTAALTRRNAFITAGMFAEDLPKGTDSDVFRRIILLGYDVYFINEAMIDYHIDNDDRMTLESVSSLRKTIVAQNHKLNHYHHYYSIYPSSKSIVLLDIAQKYRSLWLLDGQKSCRKMAFYFYMKSIIAYPFSIHPLIGLLKLCVSKAKNE